MKNKKKLKDGDKAMLVLGVFWGMQLLFQSKLAETLLISIVGRQALNRYFNLYFYLFFFWLIIIVYRNKLKKEIYSIKNNMNRSISISVGVFLFIVIGMAIGGIVLSEMNIISTNEQTVNKSAIEYPVETFLTAVVVGPFVEEIIYRGIIFGKMLGDGSKRIRKSFAYILAVFIFGVAHCDVFDMLRGEYIQLLAVFPLYILGLGLSVVYDKTKNIFYPLIVHVSINLISLTG